MSQFADYEPGLRPAQERLDAECIRMANADDAAAITEIFAEREGVDPEGIRDRVRGELTGEGMGTAYAVFVGVVEGVVAGYGRIRYLTHGAAGLPEVLPEGWYLTGVVVAPAFRRRGVGALLTEARIAWVESRASAVYYVTNVKNHTSIDLHEAFGFEEISREFAYPRVGHAFGEGVAYRLTLPGAPRAR